MDLYQLKTFFTYGKVLNFSETAKIMCVTQSAVSHSIKKLEESINTELVVRKGKNSYLTKEGKILFKSCESIFYNLENAQDKINQLKKEKKREVILGSPVEFGTTLLVKYLGNLLKNNKDIKVNFLFSHHLKKPFINDEVDFIIDCKDNDFENTMKIPLFIEHYVTIASEKYVNNHMIKSLNDLKNATIFSLDRDGAWWNNFLSVIPQKSLIDLNNIVMVNHVRGMINCAIEGLGIAFVPYYTVVNELKNKILINPFPNVLPESDNFCIYIKNEKVEFEKNKVIIDYLKSIDYGEF